MIDGVNIPEYEVTQFNQKLKDVIESNFTYVRIRGEVSQLKSASSGHIYLTLKDENSVLNATIWSQKKNYLQIQPEVGMEVIVTGKISTYAKSISTYSINIDRIELAGEGALLKLIEDRKKKLKSKGIFDEDHKKEIPFLSSKIGVITSAEGSVIHDIINRVKDRFPTNIDLWPVPVQGADAPKKIIEAIEGFNASKYELNPDVIIIARGGGSTEDLMAFNDEKLAISVYDSKIPIISAIGHETDTTIIDYVSDLRVATPTAAAEKTTPMQSELKQIIIHSHNRINNFFENKIDIIKSQIHNSSKFLKAPKHIIDNYRNKLNNIDNNFFNQLNYLYKLNFKEFSHIANLIRPPEKIIESQKKYLNNIIKDIDKIFLNKKENYIREFKKLTLLLYSNSLHSNLKKGYSVIRKSKKIINKSNLIKQEDTLDIQFLDKLLNIKVKKIN
ncbi:exodeoxyribonuclease VII large subunit [Alphaproteobacteria bacterium]|nr:exodeoxyribonuclease VII large subunit [Alphaproteobacteria bacterium]